MSSSGELVHGSKKNFNKHRNSRNARKKSWQNHSAVQEVFSPKAKMFDRLNFLLFKALASLVEQKSSKSCQMFRNA